MTYFLKSGSVFRVSTKEAMDLHELLPAGNYTVKFEKMTGQFYLEAIDSFEIKGKMYGDCLKNTDRILRTFMDRTASTGVMLAGEKGSGKSLLAKNIASTAARQGIPTIVINAPWKGDEFNKFLQMIEQPTVILFDEFEKVYDRDDQEHILTLLDGVFPSKKLFLLTCNDKYRVDQHMRNRPGRIFYMIDFKGLDASFIREYCEDNLKAVEFIDQIVSIAGTFDQFNFDMLKALVEDMNRYGETPQEVLRILNAKPEFSGKAKYVIEFLQSDGVHIPEDMIPNKEWNGNPLQDAPSIDYKQYSNADSPQDPNSPVCEGRDWEWYEVGFSVADLKKIEADGSRFTFANDDGDKLVIRRAPEKRFQYYDAF